MNRLNLASVPPSSSDVKEYLVKLPPKALFCDSCLSDMLSRHNQTRARLDPRMRPRSNLHFESDATHGRSSGLSSRDIESGYASLFPATVWCSPDLSRSRQAMVRPFQRPIIAMKRSIDHKSRLTGTHIWNPSGPLSLNDWAIIPA